MNEWQPIATAPQTMWTAPILIPDSVYGVAVVRWNDFNKGFQHADGSMASYPKWWMPAPLPPPKPVE